MALLWVGAVIFIGMGIGILVLQAHLLEIPIDYSHCTLRQCEVDFRVEKEMKGPILIYYHLKNFHQNHRSYVDSRDDRQLSGGSIFGTQCPGYNDSSKPTLPCGAVANTAFNDTITRIHRKNDYWNEVPLTDENIAFPREKHAYTINTHEDNLWNKVQKPERWSDTKWENFMKNENGYEEDLKVWMRTAALQNFRKLWRRVNHTRGTDFSEGLPENSTYTIVIENNFLNVTHKSVIIAQQNFLGAKSYKKGVISVCVGVFLALSACVLRNLAKLEEM